MLWHITNLHQGGCATYLNGTSLFHRLTEHCMCWSTAGETVITNVTIETIGEAKMHSHVHVSHVRVSQPLYCGFFPSAHATKYLGRPQVFITSRATCEQACACKAIMDDLISMQCRLVGLRRVWQQCHQGADKRNKPSCGWLHHSAVCPNKASSCLRSCCSSMPCQHRRGRQEASVHLCLRCTDSRCCSCHGRACTGAVSCVQLSCVRLRPKLR